MIKNKLIKFATIGAIVLTAAPMFASAQSAGYGGRPPSSRRAIPAIPATPTFPGAIPATPAVPQGQVLGTAAFNFGANMGMGARGQAVVELQNRLKAEGHLASSVSSTGYFGQLTRAAVIAFQRARGIANTGFVGPLTRGDLNRSPSNASKLTDSQVNSIITVLQSFDVDQATIDQVRAALTK